MSEYENDYNFDFLKSVFVDHAARKEVNEIKKMIETKLTKAVLISSIDMIFDGFEIKMDKEKVLEFVDRFADRCEEHKIPVIEGAQFFVEELCDFAGLVGDKHE